MPSFIKKINNVKIEYFIFSLVFILFSIAVFAEKINQKFETIDFQVYYTAATNLKVHKPIYEFNTTNHFVFKYSPYFAFLFIPFTYFSYPYSQLIYLFLIACVFSWSLIILCRDLGISSKILVFFLLLVFLKHLQKEIYLGQINCLVFSLLIFTIHFLKNNKYLVAAFYFSITLIIKPVGLFIFPFLCFRNKLKFSSYIVGILFILSVVLILLIYKDYFVFIAEIKSWFIELQIELQNKNILDLDNCRLDSSIYKWFGFSVLISKILALLIIGVILSTFLYLFPFPISHYLILALTPLLLSTSNNFFLFSIPIFMLVFNIFRSLDFKGKIIVVLIGILMGGNLYDIWGRRGVDLIDFYVPYSIALLMASILLIVNNFKNQQKILVK